MEKNSLGFKWWLSFIVGIIAGIALALATVFAIAANIEKQYKESIGRANTDKSLKADRQLLVNNDKYEIVFEGFDPNSKTEETLIFNLKNKTDKELSFSSDYLEVNGYVVEEVFYESLNPNETKQSYMIIKSELNKMGIEKITDLKLRTMVYTPSNDTFLEGPFEIKTNHYGKFDQLAKEKELTEKLVYDKNGIKIYYAKSALDSSKTMSPAFWFMIQNDSDRRVRITEQNTKANGITMDTVSFYPEILYPNKKTKEPLTLLLSEAEEEKLGKNIDSLEVEFEINLENKMENGKISKKSESFKTGVIKIK